MPRGSHCRQPLQRPPGLHVAERADPRCAAANAKGGAHKDHALNPLDTDFDVYSTGADGKSKPQITQKDSVDDVIRASNGSFVGLASDF